jgi:hypothetical protein
MGLKIITKNEKVKYKPKCSVQMDNKIETFTNFVTVGNDKVGRTVILQNADALTLGQALQLLVVAFKESYDDLTQPEKDLVDGVLKNNWAEG